MYEQKTETAAKRRSLHASQVADAFFRTAQIDLNIYTDLARIERAMPITRSERQALAEAAFRVGRAFEQAAAAWDNPETSMARRYRRRAREMYDAASLHDAIAPLEPEVLTGDDVPDADGE